MALPAWAQHFGISENELSESTKSLPPNGDALAHFLASGRVNEADYIAWAMRTHELPRVKPEFFSIAPDPVFWEAVKRDYAWTPTLLPLAEWNGVLLIGCLEPPQFHFRVSYDVRFVLATAQELQTRFATLQPDGVTAAVPTKISEAVTAPSLRITPAAAPIGDTTPKVAKRKITEEPDIKLPPMPEISLDRPDGLTLNIAETPHAVMVVPDGIALGSVEVPPPPHVEEKVELSPEAPDGFEEKTFSGSVKLDLGSFDWNPAKSVNAPAAPATKTETAPVEKPAEATPTAIKAKVASELPKETALRIERPPKFEVTTSGFAIPTPIPVPPTTASGQSLAPSPVVPNSAVFVPFEACTDYDELASSALAGVLKTFETGMILLFQNSELRPWRWTELFHAVKADKPDAIALDTPSIFRIVFRTCLPYHGHVVASPVNMAFFNAFNRGVLPKHATITPILVQKKVAGMVFGLSNHEVNFVESLAKAEALTKDLAVHLERIRSAKKAA